MSRNIMMNDRPLEVTGEFDPCKHEGITLHKCYIASQHQLTYAHFASVQEKEECTPERVALDRCRTLHGMPLYRDMKKQDDVPRAPYRKHPSAAERMVQAEYPYPGGRIP